MTELDIGYGYGYVIESGRIVDQSGGCEDTPKELLTVEYKNGSTNKARILYYGPGDRPSIQQPYNLDWVEEVTQSQYDVHINYEMSKFHCTEEEAKDYIDKHYVVTKACEEKWDLYMERLKLGKIIAQL